MKAIRTFFLLVISLFFPGAVLAGPISATMTSYPFGGIIATEDWANGGASLSWNVFQVGNLWQYDYSFNLVKKDLSGIIFQVSDTFTAKNIFDGTTSGWEIQTFGDEGNSTPGIPSLQYGIKFGGTGLFNDFTIVTDRAPMLGNFYAVDGKTPGSEVYAYNFRWGSCSGDVRDGTDQKAGCVVVPDTVTTSVPEPGALALLALGLGGLGLSKRRHSAKIAS